MNETQVLHNMRYRMERWDYIAMTRALTRRSWKFRMGVGALWVALVFIFMLLMGNDHELPPRYPGRAAVLLLPLLAMGAFMTLGGGRLLTSLAAASHFKSIHCANQVVELSLKPAGIAGHSGYIAYDFAWCSIRKFIETKEYVFLAISNREAVIIPRRAFASEADYQAVRRFILA